MVTVIGVRFKKAGKIYYFDPDGIDTSEADYVIVETARGVEFGSLVIRQREIPEEDVVAPLKKVLRVATEEDIEIHRENQVKKEEAFRVCVEKIKLHELEMKLIDVEYTFDNNKVIFYFTSDGRVDFRELVKDLASVFRTRIELRQIGVRDEAKMLNGIGTCGKRLCCANWLGDFEPVSIKMAKDQNLSLNPTKISGICGRLMCCLKYEHEVYLDLRKGMPKDGEIVKTPGGKAIVISTQTIREQVKVRLIVGEDKGEPVFDEDITVYKKQEIRRMKNNKATKEEEEVITEDLSEIEELI
ncbi:MAG: stage 0 sporulation family protein [Clostridia bacterium]|nr:stage 0 sporulation family protein [Clostridia bacterium]